MQTFILERSIPPRFDPSNADQVALHARWALDAYREAGAVWLGGVVTEDRMFSLVTAEHAADIEGYWRSLGIADSDAKLHKAVRPLGPFLAMARTDPRFRAPLR